MDIEFDKVKLARINELAKLAKERELTKDELKERAVLREEFLANFRAGFRQKLEGIKVVHSVEELENELENDVEEGITAELN